MAFDSEELERALRLQQQSYGLLKWLDQHLQNGSLSFNVVHRSMDGPLAAEEWLVRNRAHIPPTLLPAEPDRSDFAHLFTSYLLTSFSLPETKITERVSDCSCYCDYCSYMVSLHRLVPRHPTAKDRQNAHRLKRLFLERFVEEMGYPLEKTVEDAVFSKKDLSLALSCTTYAYELIRRTHFGSQGSALLVLWRDIAWEDGRKPKKNFELTVRHVLESEQNLRRIVSEVIGA